MKPLITEEEFNTGLTEFVNIMGDWIDSDFVTGPGRSGAIAAVYLSYRLGIPYIPYKNNCGDFKKVLIVDTVEYTGKTLRKAKQHYERKGLDPHVVYLFKETKDNIYQFWYEQKGNQK